MTYYYIDCENVGNNYDALLQRVKRYDRVVFCYTNQSPRLSFDILTALDKRRVKVVYCECLCGTPNALDFQIVMQVAKDITLAKGASYVIYSNDTGYDLPCKQWARLGHDLRRLPCGISERQLLTQLHSYGVTEGAAIKLVRGAQGCKDLVALNVLVGKHVSGKQQSSVYHALKCLIK